MPYGQEFFFLNCKLTYSAILIITCAVLQGYGHLDSAYGRSDIHPYVAELGLRRGWHYHYSDNTYTVRSVYIYLLDINRRLLDTFLWFLDSPSETRPPRRWDFEITLRYFTLVTTSLDEGSAHRRPLTTHNTHKRQNSMPPAGFEPANPASERTQTTA